MAMSSSEFLEYYQRNYNRIQTELYRLDDLDINGDESQLRELSDELEAHPIAMHRLMGLRGCLGD